MSETDLLLTFYGDDFTGSTDVLEALSRNGVQTVLFLEQPDSEDVDSFNGVQAIGLAGQSRSMSPDEMDETLPSAFETLASFDSEIFHYKVCSTFDSSPEVGSIGHAIDLGQIVFRSPFVPLVVAAPSLEPRGRYVVFGNLFATVDGVTYRLDRHPTMSQHPVTPMTESDLVRHLGKQTNKNIGLVDLTSISTGMDAMANELNDVLSTGNEIVVFDGFDHGHQQRVGHIVWKRAIAADDTLFAVGSSGLEYALTAHLQSTDAITADSRSLYDPVSRDIIVVSGSASPVNEIQLEWALDHGFEGIRLDTVRLVDPEKASAERTRVIDRATEIVEAGQNPLIYSVRGAEDPIIEETIHYAETLGIDPSEVGSRIGNQQGRIAADALDRTDIKRLCVAGGDTSGFVASHLDIYALEFVAPMGPGSPLCCAHSREGTFDELEVVFKGGQVETIHDQPDFFNVVAAGSI